MIVLLACSKKIALAPPLLSLNGLSSILLSSLAAAYNSIRSGLFTPMYVSRD
jgi:hypothetical protein